MTRTIRPSQALAEQLYGRLVEEFPEYLQLQQLLHLAEKTWPRYGIGAADLTQMDEFTLGMLRLRLGLD